MKMKSIPFGLWVWGQERTRGDFKTLSAELEALRSLNLKSDSDGKIRQTLNAFGRGYITRLAYPKNPSATVFRARANANFDPWSDVQELWARKAKDASANRFNKAGHPVLYTSADPFTALREVRVLPNTLAVVLVIKVVDSPRFAQFGLDQIPQYGVWREMMGETVGGLAAEPYFRKYVDERGIFDYWQIQDREFARIGGESIADDEPEKYRLSAQLGWQLQHGNGAEGLWYPTVARDSRSVNMCSAALRSRLRYRPTEAWLVAIGPDPVLDPQRQTDPREPIVIRRGAVEPDDSIRWTEQAHLPLHALHKHIAPVPKQIPATMIAGST